MTSSGYAAAGRGASKSVEGIVVKASNVCG